MSYTSRILHPGERILYRTRLHGITYLPAMAAIIVGLTVWAAIVQATGDVARGSLAMLPGLALWVGHWLQQHIEEHVVSSERVISRVGIIRRDVSIYPLDAIQTVEVRQGLFGRILGFGSVEIHTSVERHGSGGRHYIRAPEEWRRQILTAMDARREGWANGPTAPPPSEDIPARLKRLEELRGEGLITEDEYQARRRALLDML